MQWSMIMQEHYLRSLMLKSYILFYFNISDHLFDMLSRKYIKIFCNIITLNIKTLISIIMCNLFTLYFYNFVIDKIKKNREICNGVNLKFFKKMHTLL